MKTIVISAEDLQRKAMKQVRRPFAKGTSVVPSKTNYRRRTRNRKDRYGEA